MDPLAVANLRGLRVLIVEDEAMIAAFIEDCVTEQGCKVAHVAYTLEEAMGLAASGQFDAAILDLNLHGHDTLPVANLLRERSIPFVIATGYGVLPEGFPAALTVAKPFAIENLVSGLSACVLAAKTATAR